MPLAIFNSLHPLQWLQETRGQACVRSQCASSILLEEGGKEGLTTPRPLTPKTTTFFFYASLLLDWMESLSLVGVAPPQPLLLRAFPSSLFPSVSSDFYVRSRHPPHRKHVPVSVTTSPRPSFVPALFSHTSSPWLTSAPYVIASDPRHPVSPLSRPEPRPPARPTSCREQASLTLPPLFLVRPYCAVFAACRSSVASQRRRIRINRILNRFNRSSFASSYTCPVPSMIPPPLAPILLPST